ncbi:hypothetical protein GCM10009839_17490 [Catenulispora yoronensis]|uniref:Uncharacterized protein n=1 Tax=Catenulispora yoronensis TaxID=450799 RepID=A0ABN2TUV7_9ACTN
MAPRGIPSLRVRGVQVNDRDLYSQYKVCSIGTAAPGWRERGIGAGPVGQTGIPQTLGNEEAADNYSDCGAAVRNRHTGEDAEGDVPVRDA